MADPRGRDIERDPEPDIQAIRALQPLLDPARRIRYSASLIRRGGTMDDAAQFASVARRWAPFYRAVLDVAVLMRASDAWHLRFAATAFMTAPANSFVPLDVRTSSLRVVRRVSKLHAQTSVKAVEDRLHNIGRFSDGELSATIAPADVPLNHHYEMMHLPRMAGPRRWPALVTSVSLTNLPAFPRTEAIDLELLAHETPFETFVELLTELNVPFGPGQPAHNPITEFVVVAPAEISPASRLSDGHAYIEVLARPGMDPAKFRLGIKSFPIGATRIKRFILDATPIVWHEADDIARGECETEIPNTPTALVLLSYDGEFLGRWWIRDQGLSFNDRLQVHRTIDTTDLFRNTFFDRREEFEDRCALLLGMLGLHPMKYGAIATFTDAPDILAVSSGAHLYVVECTTGDINNRGKLQRLHDRAKAMGEVLAKTAYRPTAIQTVILTSLPRQETAAHWGIAQNLRIALVCREEITNLLQRLEAPPTPQQLYEGALAAIPGARDASALDALSSGGTA